MHFMLKATDYCNMNCTYCYVSKKQRKQKNCFPARHMPKLFQCIFEWQQSEASRGELAFNWSGGEVLTLPMNYWEEVFRIQNDVYSKGQFTFKFKNGIQTNLTLLTEDYYKLLHQHNVEIGCTIDGPRQCMDKTRQFWDGSSVFDEVMSILKRLVSINKDKPGVIVVLTKHNVDRIDEIYQMFRELDMGFQINSYHYAPQSRSNDPKNAITVKEYIKAICYLFDLWSADTKPIGISNFERAIKFLLHGRVNLCNKARNCTEHFFMVRRNGEVYPCNEFGGENFEKEYCYGNLLTNDWRQIRDHPNRKVLLNRHLYLKDIPRNKGGCKGCKYWDGCHGGCMHSIMRFECRNLRDCSPQKIAILRDIPNCHATLGIYKYIEAQLRKNATNYTVPLQLHTDQVSTNPDVRRTSFYQYHKDQWKAAKIETGSEPAEFCETEMNTLSEILGNAKYMLHLCCGVGSLLISKNGQKLDDWTGVDYRFNDNNIANTLPNGGRIEHCSDIIAWQGWESNKKWDTILINPYLIFGEDMHDLLLTCGKSLNNGGQIIIYSCKSELQKRELLEVTDYDGVRNYDKNAVAINVGGLSMANLKKIHSQKCIGL